MHGCAKASRERKKRDKLNIHKKNRTENVLGANIATCKVLWCVTTQTNMNSLIHVFFLKYVK